jgi:hypothetical protein
MESHPFYFPLYSISEDIKILKEKEKTWFDIILAISTKNQWKTFRAHRKIYGNLLYFVVV